MYTNKLRVETERSVCVLLPLQFKKLHEIHLELLLIGFKDLLHVLYKVMLLPHFFYYQQVNINFVNVPQLRKKGVLCRKAQTECDIPEYCNGLHGSCPMDIYKKTGNKCGNGKGYCFKGICPTLNNQCEVIWGYGTYKTLVCLYTLSQAHILRVYTSTIFCPL